MCSAAWRVILASAYLLFVILRPALLRPVPMIEAILFRARARSPVGPIGRYLAAVMRGARCGATGVFGALIEKESL
jgi:hypothetical protein